MVCSIAKVGVVRKALSTIMILVLFPIIYTIFALCGLWLIWIVIAIIGVYGGTIALPILIMTAIFWWISFLSTEFIKDQISIAARANQEEAKDITIGEFILALLSFTISLPTTGTL